MPNKTNSMTVSVCRYDDCSEKFDTQRGRSIHETKVHDGKIITHCNAPPCNTETHSRGLCEMHYRRWLKTVDNPDPNERPELAERECAVCGDSYWTGFGSEQDVCGKRCASYLKGIGQRLNKGVAAANCVLENYRRQAKQRGISWELDKKTFLRVIRQPCRYCGRIKAQHEYNEAYYGGFKYTGIDRLDNRYGYRFENIVPCCADCNRAKYDKSEEDFRRWVRRTYQYMFDENDE